MFFFAGLLATGESPKPPSRWGNLLMILVWIAKGREKSTYDTDLCGNMAPKSVTSNQSIGQNLPYQFPVYWIFSLCNARSSNFVPKTDLPVLAMRCFPCRLVQLSRCNHITIFWGKGLTAMIFDGFLTEVPIPFFAVYSCVVCFIFVSWIRFRFVYLSNEGWARWLLMVHQSIRSWSNAFLLPSRANLHAIRSGWWAEFMRHILSGDGDDTDDTLYWWNDETKLTWHLWPHRCLKGFSFNVQVQHEIWVHLHFQQETGPTLLAFGDFRSLRTAQVAALGLYAWGALTGRFGEFPHVWPVRWCLVFGILYFYDEWIRGIPIRLWWFWFVQWTFTVEIMILWL